MFGKRKDLSQLADSELMEMAAEGNEKAFGLLYDRYAPSLLRLFSRMLYPDNEKPHDLLQNLFMKLFQAPEKYNPAQPFKAWVYQVAANMARNELRDNRNRQRLLADMQWPLTDSNAGAAALDRQRFSQEYRKAYAGLEETEQLLLHLRFGKELTIKEIAETMEVPEGTVKSRLFYLLKKLAAHLHEFNPQD